MVFKNEKIPDPDIINFVNRSNVLTKFKRNLEDCNVHLMCIEGEEGIGKSILFDRMIDECKSCEIQYAHASWKESSAIGYFQILHKIRDALNTNLFGQFDKIIQSYSDINININWHSNEGMDISLFDHANLNQTFINEIKIGHVINIKNELSGNVYDDNNSEHVKRLLITRAFLTGLQDYLKSVKKLLVFFFDDFEKADFETAEWFMKEFLPKIFGAQKLLIVLAGRQIPELNRNWRNFFQKIELDRFSESIIEQYLQKLGISGEEAEPLIKTYSSSRYIKGIPKRISECVEDYFKNYRNETNA